MTEPSNDNSETISNDPQAMRERAAYLRQRMTDLKAQAAEMLEQANTLYARALYLEENASAVERGEN